VTSSSPTEHFLSQKASVLFDKGFAFAEKHPALLDRSNTFFLSVFSLLMRGINFAELRTGKPENFRIEKNNDYRPYLQLLQEGIQNFHITHPDIPLVWKEATDFFSTVDFIQLLNTPIPKEHILQMLLGHLSSTQLQLIPNTMTLREVITKLPPGYVNHQRITNYLVEKLPSALQPVAEEAAEYYEIMRPQSYEENKGKIEQKSKELGRPLSVSEILFIFLENEHGNIAKALEAMTIFLKKARLPIQDYTAVGKISYVHDAVNWYKSFIKDEYSPSHPYTSLPEEIPNENKKPALFEKIAFFLSQGRKKSESLNMNFNVQNQIGKAYHFAHMTSLLNHFSPEVITALSFGEYWRYGIEHGSNKLFADILLLQELKKIKEIFKNYSGAKN
jgi:hypothetical protein